MPVFYVESSALFKRYRTEPGTPVVNALFQERAESDVFTTSHLVIVEMEATGARALNGRTLTRQALGVLLRSFAEDMGRIMILPVSASILANAGQAARNHALRALDAIHFASAATVRETISGQLVLVSSDHEIVQAAKADGIPVLNPEDAGALQTLRSLRV